MESPEIIPKKFTYVDHFDNNKIIFECEATDILIADKMLEEAKGLNPLKNTNIGCKIEKND